MFDLRQARQEAREAQAGLPRAILAQSASQGRADGLPSSNGLPTPSIGFLAALGFATRRNASMEETEGSTVIACDFTSQLCAP